MNEVQQFFHDQDQKRIQILALDAAMLALEPRIQTGDVDAIDQALQLSQRKIKLLGVVIDE